MNNYFIKDCDDEETKNNYENYLKLLEVKYSRFKERILQFYQIPDNSAPVPMSN